jgi:hypothetical protein
VEARIGVVVGTDVGVIVATDTGAVVGIVSIISALLHPITIGIQKVIKNIDFLKIIWFQKIVYIIFAL